MPRLSGLPLSDYPVHEQQGGRRARPVRVGRPKVPVAIAVDEDVDIFNNTDVIWAVNTRVNPAEDIVAIPGMRIIPMDPTGKEFGAAGQPTWHRTGGKVIIDATKPPTCDPEARDLFERIRPIGGGKIRLEDYL